MGSVGSVKLPDVIWGSGGDGWAEAEKSSRILAQFSQGVFAFQIFENVKQMISLNLPSILVPLVGLVFPAVAMASLFLYIEKEQLS